MKSFKLFPGVAIAATLLLSSCESTRTRESSTTSGDPASSKSAPGTYGSSSSSKGNNNDSTQAGGSSALADKAGIKRIQMAFPTGDPSTSAVLVEKFFPAEVAVAQTFNYEIKVTNLTSHDLTGVQVTDHLPKTLKVTDSSPKMANTNPTEASWNLAKLGPKESQVIRMTGTATGEGALDMCTGLSYDNTLCASIAVTRASLQVAVDAHSASGAGNPKEVLLCEDIAIDYVVTNPGNGAARDVKVTSTLPEGLLTKDGKNSVSFNAGTIEPGKVRKFTAAARAKKIGEYAPPATAVAANGLKAEATALPVVVREPVLKVAITGPESQFIGRAHSYEATITNSGNGTANKTVLEAVLPPQFTFQSASEGGQMAAGRVRWNVGELKPGATKKVDLTVKSSSGGPAKTTVTANGYCAAEASASVNTELTGISAILLEVIDVDDPILVGSNETYIVKVTNQGSAADTDIKIVCTLDEGMECVESSGPTTGKSSGRTVEFGPLPSLAAKASQSWKLLVRCDKEGDLRFKVTMTSRQLTRPVEESEATNCYR